MSTDLELGSQSQPSSIPVTCCSRFSHWIKQLWGNWFTHIGLVIVLIGYSFIGAVIFQAIEAPNELQAKQKLNETLINLTEELWNNFLLNDSNWNEFAKIKIMEYANYFKSSGLSSELNQSVWTFWGAVFYCGTVFTTIGYGHISPASDYGRMATICYATIGVPLLLMILADIGKLFTRGIKWLWAFVRRYYYTGHCKRVRMTTTQPLKMVSKALQLQTTHFSKPTSEKDTEVAPKVYEIDDEFNLPVSVALLLWMSYLFLGATIFCQWENWTYFEAFYFCFISLSTIGLGDITPKHQMYMMLSSIYVLIGLALTSMVINVIQEFLSSTYTRATTKLSNSIGMSQREKKSKQKDLLLDETSDLYNELSDKEKLPITNEIDALTTEQIADNNLNKENTYL